MTPTDSQMQNAEFNYLNGFTSYDSKSGARKSANDIEAMMKMIRSKQKPLTSMSFTKEGRIADGKFAGYTKSQVLDALSKLSK
jgi:hypothetical protein